MVKVCASSDRKTHYEGLFNRLWRLNICDNPIFPLILLPLLHLDELREQLFEKYKWYPILKSRPTTFEKVFESIQSLGESQQELYQKELSVVYDDSFICVSAKFIPMLKDTNHIIF